MESEEEGENRRKQTEERVGAETDLCSPWSVSSAAAAPQRWSSVCVNVSMSSDSFWTVLSNFSLPERSMLRRSKRYSL